MIVPSRHRFSTLRRGWPGHQIRRSFHRAWQDRVMAPDRAGAAPPTPRRPRRATAARTLASTAVEVALQCVPAPSRVLVVRCGTGELVRRFAAASPTALAVVGVDRRPAAIHRARAAGGDDRLRFDVGGAEDLPYPEGSFDLVVCPGSPARWPDPERGLARCARLLGPGGRLVVAGSSRLTSRLASVVRVGTGASSRRRTERLLAAAGFASVQWHEPRRSAFQVASATPAAVWCPAS
jgi:SAM-dependent methyltransferase